MKARFRRMVARFQEDLALSVVHETQARLQRLEQERREITKAIIEVQSQLLIARTNHTNAVLRNARER